MFCIGAQITDRSSLLQEIWLQRHDAVLSWVRWRMARKHIQTSHTPNTSPLHIHRYGLSEGKPNEKGINVDAQVRFMLRGEKRKGDDSPYHHYSHLQTALEYITHHPILRHTKLIAFGQSLGGAVALNLVSKNEDKFAALIIENTFLSMVRLREKDTESTDTYQSHVPCLDFIDPSCK